MKLAALSLAVFISMGTFSATRAADWSAVKCEGYYPMHLQGAAVDDASLYWSFTTRLVKTDARGKIEASVDVPTHHGDLCVHGGKLFVAVNLGAFNEPAGKAESWVYVYEAKSLKLHEKFAVPDVVHGAGGIAANGNNFYVVGGLPEGAKNNFIYEYDAKFKPIRTITLKSGYTTKGIQTIAFHGGHAWMGCYGDPKILLKADLQFKKIERFSFDASTAIVPIGSDRFLVGRDQNVKGKGHRAELVLAGADAKSGLKLTPSKELPSP